MREKKVRGKKRKSKMMIKLIEEITLRFPEELYRDDYWHMHLPVAQGFINSNKTPNKIKRLCMQILINRAEHLKKFKPIDNDKYRIVAAINLPKLWDSQLIVFKGDSYFNHFFNRNDEYQQWIRLPKNRNILTEWSLSVPNNFQILGFKEIISDEDVYHEGEIWFIGELE